MVFPFYSVWFCLVDYFCGGPVDALPLHPVATYVLFGSSWTHSCVPCPVCGWGCAVALVFLVGKWASYEKLNPAVWMCEVFWGVGNISSTYFVAFMQSRMYTL